MSSAYEIRANKDLPGVYRCATMATVLSVVTSITIAVSPLRSASAQDDDVSFGTPKSILGTPNEDAEPPQVAASGRNVYIIWHEFPTEAVDQPDIFFSRSTNRGRNFQSRKNLSNSEALESSGVQIATSGRNVFVVWTETDPLTLQTEIFFRSSLNGGARFRPAKKLSDVGGPNNPRIAASGRNVFVAWQADGQAGNPDIFFIQSSDAGRNFGSEENISNNDGISEFAPQPDVLPQIAVSRNSVIVTWRDDTLPGTGFEIFVARGQ